MSLQNFKTQFMFNPIMKYQTLKRTYSHDLASHYLENISLRKNLYQVSNPVIEKM